MFTAMRENNLKKKKKWKCSRASSCCGKRQNGLIPAQCFGTFLSIPVFRAETNLLPLLLLQDYCVSYVFCVCLLLLTFNSVLWQISSYLFLVRLVLPKHKFLPKLLLLLST